MKHNIFIIAFLKVIFLVSCISNNTGIKPILHSMNGQPVIPYNANKLYIGQLENYTNIPHYEEKIKQRIIDKIIINGRLAIVPVEENSDVKVTGSVQLFEVQPIMIDNTGIIKKKRLLIIAVISLINTHTNSYIFKNMPVQAFKEFSDIDFPLTPFNIVQDEVEQNLALRIALQIETGWYTSLKSDVEKGKQ